jgi:hypothetical protein
MTALKKVQMRERERYIEHSFLPAAALFGRLKKQENFGVRVGFTYDVPRLRIQLERKE